MAGSRNGHGHSPGLSMTNGTIVRNTHTIDGAGIAGVYLISPSPLTCAPNSVISS
jgi:hypothetical protein